MFLHQENVKLFKEIIDIISEKSNRFPDIIEKDYYVTLILKEIAQRAPGAVFKGGTCLSKAFRVINRFSEDIDIAFDEHIGHSRRKKVKYQLLLPISELLNLPIKNWAHIESDKNLNHYDFVYQSVIPNNQETLIPYVKLETSMITYSFPVLL